MTDLYQFQRVAFASLSGLDLGLYLVERGTEIGLQFS